MIGRQACLSALFTLAAGLGTAYGAVATPKALVFSQVGSPFSLLERVSTAPEGVEPKYGPAAGTIIKDYSQFLLAHPGTSALTAPGGGGSIIVRFEGPSACVNGLCTTTVLLPDRQGNLYQAFSQDVSDLRLLPPKRGSFPWLSTEDGGIWKIGGKVYVEDLNSLGMLTVPAHYLGGNTKAAVDEVLSANRWPQNSSYVVDVVPPSGAAPETLVIVPDQATTAGRSLCAGIACPLWMLVPSPAGGWVVAVKTSGTGAYAILYATNDAGGHDVGVADAFGWNEYSWLATQKKWVLTREVANLPPVER